MSANSAQSMHNRAVFRQQQLQRLRDQHQNGGGGGQSSTEENNNNERELVGGGEVDFEDMDEQMMLNAMELEGRQGIGAGSGQQHKLTMKELKERKKSLMTRLIPGRNGPNGEGKRV